MKKKRESPHQIEEYAKAMGIRGMETKLSSPSCCCGSVLGPKSILEARVITDLTSLANPE